jgi:hypothetical protein
MLLGSVTALLCSSGADAFPTARNTRWFNALRRVAQ